MILSNLNRELNNVLNGIMKNSKGEEWRWARWEEKVKKN